MASTCNPCSQKTLRFTFWEQHADFHGKTQVFADIECTLCGRVFPVSGGEDTYPD